MTRTRRWLVALALATATVSSVQAQQVEDREKLAQTGFKFLSLAGDARAAGLSAAMTAREGGAAMLFYNPAGMAWFEGTTDVSLSQTNWIADITHNHGAIAFRPAGGRFGVVGASLSFADYGDLTETVYADNEQGYVELGAFAPSAFAIGLGYANAVTERFSVGGQVKYATEDFGDVVSGLDDAGGYQRESIQEGTVAYDFGVHYKTGFESLRFALSARNFATEVTFAEESFQLPLTLQIGVAMDVLDLTSLDPSMHSLVVGVDAANPRDFSEQVKVGAEYTFLDTFQLRGGYTFPTDEEGISLGAGVQQTLGGVGFHADYAFTDFGVFSRVHRVAVRFSL